MIYEERPAPAGLEAAISRVWYLEVPRERPYEKILPQPAMHLIVNLSEPYALYDRSGAATTVGDAFVSGIQSEYLVIASPPVIRQVVVEVRPGGLGAISALTGADVAGRVRPPARWCRRGGLVAGLRAAATPAEALERVGAALARLGAGWRPDPVVEATLAGLEDEDRRDRRPRGRPAGLAPHRDRALPARHRADPPRLRAAVAVPPLRDRSCLIAGNRATGRASRRSVATTTRRTSIRAFRRFSGWTPTEYRRRVAEFGPAAASFVPLDEVPSAG